MEKLVTLLAASIFATSVFANHADDLAKEGVKLQESGNIQRAIEKYVKASDEGSVIGSALAGAAYTNIAKYALAAKYLKIASNAGDSSAENALGALYSNGQGVTKSYSKANELFEKSVKQNYFPAYFNLGTSYYFGDGVSKDKVKAIQLYTQSANGGYPQAQTKLGAAYQIGDSVQTNLPQSYMWYTLAVKNGDQSAKNNYIFNHIDQALKQNPYCISLGQDNVSQAYMNGIGGLKKSQSEALDWMEKAQETDPSLSIVNLDLAKMYALNDDKDKAFDLAQKAVTQPYAPAMQYLGTMYQQGIGTSKDLVKAYAYLTLAEDLYKKPDDKFFSTFAAPCMPNYKQTTKEFNVEVTLTQLNELHLSGQAVAKAEVIMKKVKESWKK